MSWPKRKGKLTASSNVLQNLLESGKSPLSDQFLRWKLWARWKEIVGPSIAEQTDPVGYRFGTLYVWVKNSSWMQQLIFMQETITNTINTKLGETYVKNIRFTMDRRSVPSADQSELKKVIEDLVPESED